MNTSSEQESPVILLSNAQYCICELLKIVTELMIFNSNNYAGLARAFDPWCT